MADLISAEQRKAPHPNIPQRRNHGRDEADPTPQARTTYLSRNDDADASFQASFPPGSKHAAKLRELCVQFQDGSTPREGTATAIADTDGGSGNRAVLRKDEQQAPGTRSRGARSGSGMTAAAKSTTAPRDWCRHETAREVAYHSKSANREVFVSAPKGSEEADYYDGIARKTAGPKQYKPLEEDRSTWISRFWK